MIYLGNFVYLNSQQEMSEVDRRHGEFNLIIEAPDGDAAISMFRKKIEETREATELFAGECRIFLIQLLEFDNFPRSEPMLINYKSVAGDPAMPFIRCAVPGEDHQICRIFDWQNNRPKIDGEGEDLFLAFEA